MKKIQLGRTYHFAIVDDEDFEILTTRKWQINKGGYCYRFLWKDRKYAGCVYMHRFLMGFPELKVDHINRNKLDNRRSNLRIADDSLNAFNKSISPNNVTGYVGVSWDKRKNRWIARAGKKVLGTFRDKDDAVSCRAAFNLKIGIDV